MPININTEIEKESHDSYTFQVPYLTTNPDLPVITKMTDSYRLIHDSIFDTVAQIATYKSPLVNLALGNTLLSDFSHDLLVNGVSQFTAGDSISKFFNQADPSRAWTNDGNTNISIAHSNREGSFASRGHLNTGVYPLSAESAFYQTLNPAIGSAAESVSLVPTSPRWLSTGNVTAHTIANEVIGGANFMLRPSHVTSALDFPDLGVHSSEMVINPVLKFETVNILSGVKQDPWNSIPGICTATARMASIDHSRNMLVSDGNALIAGVETGSLVLQTGSTFNKYLNGSTFSMVSKPGFDFMKGLSSFDHTVTLKPDYLSSGAERYQHATLTAPVRWDPEDHMNELVDRLLSRIPKGFSAAESKAEFTERVGNVEYHIHFHLTILGDCNMVGDGNIQIVKIFAHDKN